MVPDRLMLKRRPNSSPVNSSSANYLASLLRGVKTQRSSPESPDPLSGTRRRSRARCLQVPVGPHCGQCLRLCCSSLSSPRPRRGEVWSSSTSLVSNCFPFFFKPWRPFGLPRKRLMSDAAVRTNADGPARSFKTKAPESLQLDSTFCYLDKQGRDFSTQARLHDVFKKNFHYVEKTQTKTAPPSGQPENYRFFLRFRVNRHSKLLLKLETFSC